jgi:hypothetical protein
MNKLIIPAILTATVLVAGMFAFMPIQKASTVHSGLIAKRFIVESDSLSGLPAGQLRPFIDTTPDRMTVAHIAVTDASAACAGATAPTNVNVLVGQAGVALSTNVLVAATNTGIGAAAQCVFHVTIVPGTTVNGVVIPATVTDIVVSNVGVGALTGTQTITISAEVND